MTRTRSRESHLLRRLCRRGAVLLRRVWTRARDAAPDTRDWLGAGSDALPPPRLRRRVGLNSSRREYDAIGRQAATDVARLFLAGRDPSRRYPRWLDFGCGPGRVARHLARLEEIDELWGADVDREAVDWAASNLPGHYVAIGPDPPTPSPPNHFDVIYAGSVFTHLAEARQGQWLAELHRILAPGGLLLASTHSPSLSFMRPDLEPGERQVLVERGFLFAPGSGPFSDDSAFHSREYLLSTWGKLFGLAVFLEYGLNGYQDLTAWRKW